MRSDELLSNRMKDLAENVDPAALERVRECLHRGKASRWSGRRATLAAGVLGAAAAAAVIVTLNATGVLGGVASRHSPSAASATSAHGEHGPGDFVPLAHPGKPCLGAEKVPLAALPAQARSSVWMPAAALANRTNLTGTWTCGGTPTLTFGDITVSFAPAANTPDPTTWFTDLAARGNVGQVETLLGRPAYVKGPDATGGLGEAMIVVGNTLVTVIGDGHATAEDLAAVISSIDVAHPLPSRAGG